MATRRSIDPGIEMNGMFIDTCLDAFKLFPSIALKRLLNFGIGTLQGKDIVVDRQAWYPLESWIAANEDIANSVGARAAFSIGQQIPKFLTLPPNVTDIHALFGGLNIVYHMHHRKNGKNMFDPNTGTCMSGIGDYKCTMEGRQKIICISDNVYPCDIDRGLLTGMAQRFERMARVTHDERQCRKTGGSSCTYVIAW